MNQRVYDSVNIHSTGCEYCEKQKERRGNIIYWQMKLQPIFSIIKLFCIQYDNIIIIIIIRI